MLPGLYVFSLFATVQVRKDLRLIVASIVEPNSSLGPEGYRPSAMTGATDTTAISIRMDAARRDQARHEEEEEKGDGTVV